MTAKARFIKSVIETAKQDEVQMPWARGARRAAMIARRARQTRSAQAKSA